MKITGEMMMAAASATGHTIHLEDLRKALEAGLSVRAKYTREQINEMVNRGEMFVDHNPEADWIAAAEMACPHCGGSGHKDDVRPLSALPAGVKMQEDEIIFAVKRPEGYEDVHPQLVGEDCFTGEWEWRILPAIEPAGVGVETPPPQTHMAGWQDISTAPKNTKVLAAYPMSWATGASSLPATTPSLIGRTSMATTSRNTRQRIGTRKATAPKSSIPAARRRRSGCLCPRLPPLPPRRARPMTDGPRQNERLLSMEERTYDVALFSGDKGMWTIFEIVKRPVAQAPSEGAANRIIKALISEGKKP